MNRRTRLAAALVATAAMLFAPLAMALHACTANMPAEMHAMAGGDGGAPMDMALCERHCSDGKVSLDTAKPPPSPMGVPVVAALRVDALEPLSLRAPGLDSPFFPAAGPAPPLIRFTVLRI